MSRQVSMQFGKPGGAVQNGGSGSGWTVIQSDIALSGTLNAHAGRIVSGCQLSIPSGYSVVANVSEFVNGQGGILAGPNGESDYNSATPDIYIFNTSATNRSLSSATLRILTIIKPG